MALTPMLADDDDPDAAKKAAVAAMQTWLGEMDSGSYAQTWTEAAKSFQKAVSSEQWVAVSGNVRKPLGKLLARKLDSALLQSGQTTVGTAGLAGTYVIAQFDTSFENMKYARETVTFEKEGDGAWRAAGYFIKPT